MTHTCPACLSLYICNFGNENLLQCQNCETVFGNCTKAEKERIFGHKVSKDPKVNSDCRYVNIRYLDGLEIKQLTGWYDFKKEEIASLNIPNGVQHEQEIDESTRE